MKLKKKKGQKMFVGQPKPTHINVLKLKYTYLKKLLDFKEHERYL